MLGRNHVVLTLGSASLLAIPYLPGSLQTVALVLGGAWIGAYLPDLDTPNMKIVKGVVAVPFASQIVRSILFTIVHIGYICLFQKFDPNHRGSLHTLLGIAMYSAVICGAGYAVLRYTGYWDPVVLWFFAGLVGGGVMHLIEDSCTRWGVQPFLPLWGHKFKGGITTGSGDFRPEVYGSVLFALAGCLLYLNLGLGMIQQNLIGISVITLLTAWSVFFIISKIPRRGK
jgi:inner membrane protein